jgi:RNA polymerase sigma-70 factor (ECF subfamily)
MFAALDRSMLTYSASNLCEPLSHSDELAMIDELLTRSERAWRHFHQRFDRLIRRCITKVTARFKALLGEDDVREIYAILLAQLVTNDMHKLRSFDPKRGHSLSSWIGLLAINAAYDYLRVLRRDPGRASLVELEDISSELPSPLEHVEERQRAELLANVLRALSAKDQEFVALYFGEGLPPEQVAARMSISVKTVYSKKHKIQSRLEQLLSAVPLAA